MKLLLTKAEIEKIYSEGMKNALFERERRAARTWRVIHLRHPWRGFFLDVMGAIAQASPFAVQPISRVPWI